MLTDTLGVVLLFKGFILELYLENGTVGTFTDFGTRREVSTYQWLGPDTAASPGLDWGISLQHGAVGVMLVVEAMSHSGLSHVSLEQQAA